jgi:hypothetical protein
MSEQEPNVNSKFTLVFSSIQVCRLMSAVSGSFSCPICADLFDDDVVLELHVHEHFHAVPRGSSSPPSLHSTLALVSERDVLNQLVASLPSLASVAPPASDDDSDSDATVPVDDVGDDADAADDTADDDDDVSAPPGMLFSRPTSSAPAASAAAAAAVQADEDFALALALSLQETPATHRKSSSHALHAAPSARASAALPWAIPSRTGGAMICAPATVANVVSLCRAFVPANRLAAVFAMCSDVDHFQSRWDRGWGCGWRNLQQFVSALSKRPEFAARLWHGALNQVPTIGDLQKALENAWALGFDRLGQQQLQSVSDSRRWVGTTEMVAALRSRDINVRIAAFPRPSGGAELALLCPGAVVRNKPDVHYGLVAWVIRYFRARGVVERAWSGTPRPPPGGGGRGGSRGAFLRGGTGRGGGGRGGKKRTFDENEPQQARLDSFGFFGGEPRARSGGPQQGRLESFGFSESAAFQASGAAEEQGVLATDPLALATASVTAAAPFVPPLYLQHQGHSRTIVGYEIKHDGAVNLLILDPSTQGLFEGVRSGDLRQLRRGEATLTKRQYEIVYLHAARPLLESDAERHGAKTLHADEVVE